ncbi:MAG: hypothetical protein SFV21_10195, partial [Rhodospirillaceae bacterium]|nr:hypothetical protein [Rhodospirillaceae bacterium]
GHSDAAFMLGWIHQMGETGKIDYEQAANWYRKASETVLNQKAQFNLRGMIEAGQVRWQNGDPGQPPEVTPDKAPASPTTTLRSASQSG